MNIEVGRNQYFVEISGQGERVVMLHGFTGTTKTWDQLVNKLSDQFKCIRIDLPGHGQTKAQIENMEQCCYEINQVLKSLSIDSYNLIGYSMGGRTALVFASMFKEDIKKLILVGASPGLEGQNQYDRAQRDERLAHFILEKGIEAFVDYWEDLPLFDSQKKLDVKAQESIRMERLNQQEHGLAMSLRTMGTGVQPSMWSELHALKMPVILLTGELDFKFNQLNEKMVKRFPNAIHQTIPNAGHASHLENPNFFGKIVLKALNL